MYTITVVSAAGETLARAEGLGDARLIYRGAYQPGDRILFQSENAHAAVLVDQAVAAAPVFLPDKAFSFEIPFGDAANGYPPQAFSGDCHAMTVGPVGGDARRNVALNPFDQRGDGCRCFPHASANVETRGEAQFFARNAVDGHRFNESHGGWPYHSWGIGGRADAWIRVDFGRSVTVDEVVLTLRADFPHDAWWTRATLACSDGFALELPLEKTVEAQRFAIGERAVEWVMLRDLIKADVPSIFPALTQFEVYGREAEA